jgi:hypothetical protein
MSDKQKFLVTPVGTYTQDEDGQGWTLLTKDKEEAALIDESMHHLTNKEAEQFFQYEINMAKLREAVGALYDGIQEIIRILHQRFSDIMNAVSPSVQETWELLRELADETEEKEPKKHQRPDYGARPKCRACAKTKRDRKQRSRER